MQVVVYQPQVWRAVGDETEETQPLLIGVQTAFQARNLASLTHGAAVLLDTTHGTNNMMVGCASCVVRVMRLLLARATG